MLVLFLGNVCQDDGFTTLRDFGYHAHFTVFVERRVNAEKFFVCPRTHRRAVQLFMLALMFRGKELARWTTSATLPKQSYSRLAETVKQA